MPFYDFPLILQVLEYDNLQVIAIGERLSH